MILLEIPLPPGDMHKGGLNSGAPLGAVLILLGLCLIGALCGWLWYRRIEARRTVTRYVFDEQDRLIRSVVPLAKKEKRKTNRE